MTLFIVAAAALGVGFAAWWLINFVLLVIDGWNDVDSE